MRDGLLPDLRRLPQQIRKVVTDYCRLVVIFDVLRLPGLCDCPHSHGVLNIKLCTFGGQVKNDHTDDTRSRYCEDCRVLTEALRDMEQQCRELEDERFRVSAFRTDLGPDALYREEDEYLANLSKLQRRRDCALEVLFEASGPRTPTGVTKISGPSRATSRPARI
jgi:hypothetical protein